MLFELVLALGLVFPGLLLTRLAGLKFDNSLESLSFSYVLSLALIFGVLYLGGIANAFGLASFLILAIELTSFVYFFALLILRFPRLLHQLRSYLFSGGSGTRLVVIITVAVLVSIYAAFLYMRAIFDSDVVETYLPLARQIASTNSLTYDNGYDYLILLKPIGVSVLYAWAYVINGSTLSEVFRLMPVIPVLMLVLINFQISVSVTKSRTLGLISSAILIVLPFNDRLLYYNAFYPDMFYYPLIFMTVYLLIKYSQTRNGQALFWAGLALGVASLLKAQTIYFLIAFLVAVIALEFKSRKFPLVLCCLTPFMILVPSTLAVTVQREGLSLSVPSLTSMQLELLLFLSAFSVICYLLVSRDTSLKGSLGANRVRRIAKKMLLLLVPFSLFSCLWYLNNLLRFGTILYTSSINLPNFSWATAVLNSIGSSPPIADIWSYVAYFTFAFVHPAVMGYVMMIPVVMGLYSVLKKRLENFGIFFLFGIISTSIILSATVLSLPSGSGYNPRDILPLAPLLSTVAAVGIYSVVSRLFSRNSARTVFVSLVLVAYFGVLNYVHSVLVLYVNMRSRTFFTDFISYFAGIVGLDLEETSFQIVYAYQAASVGENLLRILGLSLVAGIPLLALLVFQYYRSARKPSTNPETLPPSNSRGRRLSRRTKIATNLLLVCIIVSVVAYPRLGIPTGQLDPQSIQEDQLRSYYGQAYGAFTTKYEGGVLTFGFLPGLAYYSPGIKVVDLRVPANLAYLRDCFNYSAPIQAVGKLKNHTIRYILIMNSSQATMQLDSLLNYTLTRITQNASLASLVGVFGGWYLFDMGP